MVPSDLALKQAPSTKDSFIMTRNGTSFDPATDYWKFSTNGGLRSFDLSRIDALCSTGLALAARKTIAWYLENRSIPHANNLYNRFLHFVNAMVNASASKVDSITETMIVNYRESLGEDTEWYLGNLRCFLLKISALGYSGMTSRATGLLEEITLAGNKKGWAVLTMDEEEGPFTDMELRLIRAGVVEAFGDGRMSLRQAALVWIFITLGLRSSQAADLKRGDLELKMKDNGKAAYFLHVPRVKQRGQKRRKEFKERELDGRIGQIVEAWSRQVAMEYSGLGVADHELPLFPCVRKTANAEPGFHLHSDSALLRGEVVRLFDTLGIVSPRTGKPMKIIPRRFRYTLGTRAVIHGAGAAVVAELLDHSDLQNVLVYTKFSDELIEELNAELADDLGPLAQAFRGEIVLFDEGDLSEPDRLIGYPGLDPSKGYTGKCKCGGECGEVSPIFCYQCPYFKAFIGAPHEEALQDMMVQQEKERQLGNDIVARQLDECIAACREVIRKSQEAA